MVVACLYGYIDKQTDGIDRHKDREHKDREQREAIHPDAYLSGLSGVCRLSVGCFGWFVSLWFVSVVRLIGSDFLTSIKKFFNFPNFFHNYLIFNAFQI